MRKIILILITCFTTLGYTQDDIEQPSNPTTTNHPMIQDSSSSSPPSDYASLLKKTVFMVVGLIGLIFLTIYILKKFAINRTMQVNQVKHIKIVERRSISPKTVLYLVQIGDKRTLLSESQFEVRSHKFLQE
ncbi:MAG: flagellar biosynthetic protein FliO [Chlamydiales bacterium]|nr:flagellar biosynthetic protein FliO [Chlamydiales bacterium]